MNAVLAPFRELVERRLWPVALVLLAVAVAIPVLLAAPGGEPVAPAATAAGTDPDAPFAGQAIASVATEDGTVRRRVLGAPKDPFTPTGRQPKPAKPAATPGAPAASGAASPSSAPGLSAPGLSGGSTPSGGGSSGGFSPPTAGPPTPPSIPSPAPVAPATPDTDGDGDGVPAYSLAVKVDDQPRVLNRLAALPDDDNPAIIYLGLLEDAKTAVFLLDAEVDAEGDGSCHPSPSDCQRLHLKKGETEFLSVGGGEGATSLQLDLVAIKAGKPGAGAARATSSRGRRALRSRMSRVGPLRFDARTGKLRSLTPKGWRAARARAAAAGR